MNGSGPQWELFMKSILLRPDVCFNQIGFNPQEFEEFYQEMEQSLINYTHRHTKRRRHSEGKMVYPHRLQLFLTLHWLRRYPSCRDLSAFYGIHYETLQHFYERCVGAMAENLVEEVPIFSHDELEKEGRKWANSLGPDFEGVAAVIDGTCIRIYHPGIKKFARQSWVSRKAAFCVNVLVAVSIDGKFMNIGTPVYGGNDQADWKHSDWRSIFLYEDYGIMGDAGFTFNPKSESTPIKGITPARRPKGGILTRAQLKRNREIASWRVVVENTIAQWKQWRILGGTYRHSKVFTRNRVQLRDIVIVTCVLTNRRLKSTPLREEGWQAKWS